MFARNINRLCWPDPDNTDTQIMSFELPFLFFAGFLGGMLNSIAGGGTFITFPALLFVGVPPISANATNTFASCSGYMSGAYAFRRELALYRSQLPKYIITSLLGGLAGAWLLLQTSEASFREAIPWLLLFATFIFIFGEKMNKISNQLASWHKYGSSIWKLLLLFMLLGVCIYGGFFNAGLGIVILSYLALAGYTNINSMNGLKLLTSSCVSLIAIVLFIYDGAIAWSEGFSVLLGTLLGGYFAARISRHITQSYVRRVVILASSTITLYYFYVIYGI